MTTWKKNVSINGEFISLEINLQERVRNVKTILLDI